LFNYAKNNSTKEILFGEVKWSKKPVGIDIMQNLKRKARLVEWKNRSRKEFYCLFSRSGFTEEMRKLAARESIILFHQDQLVE